MVNRWPFLLTSLVLVFRKLPTFRNVVWNGPSTTPSVGSRPSSLLISHELSGALITQYAAAALVSENKVLAHPASDRLNHAENQRSCFWPLRKALHRKAGEICFNVRRVIATEILAACQAIDLRAGEGFKLGDGTQAAYDTVRKTNAFIAYDKDIEMFKELEKITDVVKRGDILEAVEDKADLKFF